jgi:uncharacterized protein
LGSLQRIGYVASFAGALVCVGIIGARTLRRLSPPPVVRISLQPNRVLADGYDSAVLSIETTAQGEPQISFSESSLGARVERSTEANGTWKARIRSGVLPGRLTIRVNSRRSATASVDLDLLADTHDRFEDGTPDLLRLDEEHDRQAFRRWFTYLAEAQYFQPATARPTEIVDCAALIRYAYREALTAHNGAWTEAARLSVVPAFESVLKYQYPRTPLNAALFRVRPGPFRSSDPGDGTFLQFADASTLRRFNTHFVSRDVSRAMPGDLLFFRRRADHESFHSMVFLGESQIAKDGKRYVLYHTGPDGSNPGELKRVSMEELLHYPESEWRPTAGNPNFLGVSRWNILRRSDLNATND